jgi:hypothetical protein
MKEIHHKVDSCESRRVELDSGCSSSNPNPAIRRVFCGELAHGEVERRLPIPFLGDTLMTSGVNRDGLEARLRLAMAELEQRVHSGEDCFAEEYFAADPELAENVENAIDLIYEAEFCAYRDAGRSRSPEDYYRRFPQWRNELERQFFIDGLEEPHLPQIFCMIGSDGSQEQYYVLKDLAKSPNGRVVKARHARRNCIVAIKTFAGDDPADEERFRTGAREQERLRHPNILPVHDVGESEEGTPCFSMEFADGGSLDQHIAGKPQPPEEAARLVRTLAEAMSYVHGQGTIHRDLKPANILLHKKPELRIAKSENGANGAVKAAGFWISDFEFKITDLGLARRVDVPGGPSKTGEILGTVPYMAPEQAAGRIKEVGALSDVYALGAILYELLTGKPPFQGRTVVESLQQVLTHRPVRPRRLVRGVPRGLESICLKCLEKNPRRRYGSAKELADDLGRWLEGKRPRAHVILARAGRFLRRHVVLSTAAALMLFATTSARLAIYSADPERKREWIERQLVAGKEVTLIGEEGMPKWHRWATNEATQKYLLAQDGSFRLASEGFGLLELVRDPQHSRYRLSAWARHDENLHTSSAVGIYFEYGKQCTSTTEHHLCAVTLNGLTDFRKRYPTLKGNPATLAFRRVLEADSNEISRDICSLAVPVDWHPIPVWRQIAVEVSPEKIKLTLSWPSETGWESATTEVIRDEVQKVKNSAFVPPELIGILDARALLDVAPELPGPRGSLGLYVYMGSVSFRNVVVHPNP